MARRTALCLLVLGVIFLAACSAGADGSGRIVFTSNRDGNPEIYMMNGDGSAQTRLTANNAIDWHPVWSPEGGRIAYVSNRDGNMEIYTMQADGSGQTRLTRNEGDDAYPAWSPDGTKIAFSSEQGRHMDLCVMNADGTELRRLTDNGATNINPVWPPDGAKLYFFANYKADIIGAKTGLYVVNVNDGNVTKISKKGGHQFALSPDGTKLVYVEGSFSSVGGETYFGTNTKKGTYKAFLIGSDGQGRAKAIGVVDGSSFPSWSPDGSRIAYISGSALRVISSEGKGKQVRIKIPFAAGNVAWSPDGTRVACMGSEGMFKKMSIYVALLDGGGVTRLTESTWDVEPVWAPR